MNVLVACEYSGIVRDAFLAEGHDAISCDLLPTESPGPHVQGDVRPLLKEPWDLVIAHPPCTHLCHLTWSMGNHKRACNWWGGFETDCQLFEACLEANAPRVAVENPSQMNPPARTLFGPPQDKIEPYYFGHKFRKRTGLWLKGLPPLMRGVQVGNPTSWVSAGIPKSRKNNPGGKIGLIRDPKLRARFWPGIAKAMAQQWGHLDQPRARHWGRLPLQ